MFRSSMLGDILKLLPRDLVKGSVSRHSSDRWRKSFKTWDHLVAMLMAQLSGASSLRDVALLSGRHCAQAYHLGCGPVKRSTLCDANQTRDAAVFGDIVQGLIAGSPGRVRKTRKLLSLLDSTPIRLAGRGNQWAQASRSRHHNQGLKIHVLMTPDDGQFDYVAVTDMNVTDITDARQMPLTAGRIYVFDKGYCDYDWWSRIIDTGSHFVTRLKANAAWRQVERRSCDDPGIVSDRIIMLTNKSPRGGKTNPLAVSQRELRLVEIPHPAGPERGKTKPFMIVSDMLEAPASEIAAHYKKRWDIEILFKWIKQNLKIKTFMGESRNAILIQIYIAIIAYLLIHAYAKLVEAGKKTRMRDLLILCAAGLFHPYKPPPDRSKNSKTTQQSFRL